MDVKEELKKLLNDPLLDVTYQEAKLFDIPEDMRAVVKKRHEAEYIAIKKVCDDFDSFRPLFESVKADLDQGKRSLKRVSKTEDFFEGNFYIVGGQMVYLAQVGAIGKDRAGHNKDARTRCIYDNGVESDILLQTLRKAVFMDGYAITQTQEQQNDAVLSIAEGDKCTGFIYVLKSLSKEPEIANQKDLYKIGFTTQKVQERIANAINEPTYLMAPVQIMMTAQIVNMNSHHFETILHQVFHQVQFQVSVFDGNGVEHRPDEWYVVPLEIISSVINKIVDRSIVNYTYNSDMKCLEKRIAKQESTFNTSGLKVLTLPIKQVFFDEIMNGTKTVEYRELKQTTLNSYTYIDPADGKRYLRRYDVLRLGVGYSKNRESALVEVTDTTYDSITGMVEFHLGKIFEHINKK